MKHLIYITLLVVTLSSCSLGLQNSKYAYDSLVLNNTNSGVVIGSELQGAGISFMNLDTMEEIHYYSANIFCIRLPAGKYSLYNIGTSTGAIASKNPYVFEVINNQIVYIGTIVNSGSISEEYATSKKYKYYRKHDRGLSGSNTELELYGNPYRVNVINNFDDLNDGYKEDCPDIKNHNIIINIMAKPNNSFKRDLRFAVAT